MQRLAGSFRDPSGFVFRDRGVLRRQVNHAYAADYDRLMASGLYEALAVPGLLVRHREVEVPSGAAEGAYRVLEPELVPFVSYPYEWSFSQLRDAALLTLQVQDAALEHGMTLKDASAFNVQWMDGRPVLIDTLSFRAHAEGEPWIAYRQFCQHFLAPLLLMSHVDVRLAHLWRAYLDGIPLDLASRLLPRSTWMRPGILLHVHLHARSLARHAGTSLKALPERGRMSTTAVRGLVDSLRGTVAGLRWKPEGTEWAEYVRTRHYAPESVAAKTALVREYLGSLPAPPRLVLDLGANTGEFSRVAAESGARVVAFDVDPAAVERNYLDSRGGGPVLPLVLDLTNPSPGLGWAGTERMAWSERGNADVVMALALVHHLAIANNVPLPELARFFAGLAPVLLVEFVPKDDPQVLRLLGSREDIFPDYTAEGFEAAFAAHFTVGRREPVPGTGRIMYRMDRHG